MGLLNVIRLWMMNWACVITIISSCYKKISLIIHSGFHGNNLCTYDHWFTKSSRILTLEKLTSKEIYDFFIFKVVSKPVFNLELGELFQGLNLTEKKFTACYI